MQKRFQSVFLTITFLFFAVHADATTFKVLHAFAGGTTDGASPTGVLTLDSKGNLYGTTRTGGDGLGCDPYGCGTVFKVTNPNGQRSESVLYNFTNNGTDADYPYYGVIFDQSGNLYGEANSSNSSGCGAVFELFPGDNWTESTIYSFGCGTDGENPTGGLTSDSQGNLYGTTWLGGNTGCNFEFSCGVVFKLSPNGNGTWTESVIYSFQGGYDGGNPYGGVIFDGKGNLYGTTIYGGFYNSGTVFRLTPGSNQWTETTLYSFTGGDNGQWPYGGVVFDTKGNLYGTTEYGGADTVGTVYKLTPTKGLWQIKTLHAFTGGTDGAFPLSSLVFDKLGNLYGATPYGGGLYGFGNVYKLAPLSNGRWKDVVLHSFTGGRDGEVSFGALVLDNSGNLYGNAQGGGSSRHGVVFEIRP